MEETKRTIVSVEILERLKSLDNLPHFPETLLKIDREIANNPEINLNLMDDMLPQNFFKNILLKQLTKFYSATKMSAL